jgi:hypothetical protein
MPYRADFQLGREPPKLHLGIDGRNKQLGQMRVEFGICEYKGGFESWLDRLTGWHDE